MKNTKEATQRKNSEEQDKAKTVASAEKSLASAIKAAREAGIVVNGRTSRMEDNISIDRNL
jgi:hypothetical protein